MPDASPVPASAGTEADISGSAAMISGARPKAASTLPGQRGEIEQPALRCDEAAGWSSRSWQCFAWTDMLGKVAPQHGADMVDQKQLGLDGRVGVQPATRPSPSRGRSAGAMRCAVAELAPRSGSSPVR